MAKYGYKLINAGALETERIFDLIPFTALFLGIGASVVLSNLNKPTLAHFVSAVSFVATFQPTYQAAFAFRSNLFVVLDTTLTLNEPISLDA